MKNIVGAGNFEMARRFAVPRFEGATCVEEVDAQFRTLGDDLGEHGRAGFDVSAVVYILQRESSEAAANVLLIARMNIGWVLGDVIDDNHSGSGVLE